MTLDEVIRASTSTPARAIGRQGGIGSMAVGASADLSILELRTGHWDLPDAAGHTEVVERLLVPKIVIRAGHADAIEAPDPGHSASRVFADARPAEVEEEAVARVLATARLAGAACYLVHLSSGTPWTRSGSLASAMATGRGTWSCRRWP